MTCSYTAIRQAGEALNFELVKTLYQQKPSVHMANMSICGAGNTFEKHAKDSKEAKAAMEILHWAMGLGGCLLFFQRSTFRDLDPSSGEKPNSFFTRVSMRKGPGDIAKGTFKKLTE
jgi:hypothetical protein